jgi:hypothetical protein
MRGEILDLQGSFVLFGYIASRTADAADLTALIVRNPRIDPYPAIAAIRRDQMGEVVLYFAMATQCR